MLLVGGPSGMISAIKASKDGNEVILLEKMNSLRKKTTYNRKRKM